MAGYTSPEVAFAYINGKLHFGLNHLQIMTELGVHDEETDITYWLKGANAFGWIWNTSDGTQTAEFYSDNYNWAQDSLIFDDIYKQLKEEFPKLTELSFGPADDLLAEFKDLGQWSEQAEDFDLPTPSHLKVSFRWTKETGLEIV